MKKVLILLGIVAVIGFGYYRYSKSDTALDRTLKSYCDTREYPESCYCLGNAVREAYGREKYVDLIDLMKKDNVQDIKHFLVQTAYNAKAWEVDSFHDILQRCEGVEDEG